MRGRIYGKWPIRIKFTTVDFTWCIWASAWCMIPRVGWGRWDSRWCHEYLKKKHKTYQIHQLSFLNFDKYCKSLNFSFFLCAWILFHGIKHWILRLLLMHFALRHFIKMNIWIYVFVNCYISTVFSTKSMLKQDQKRNLPEWSSF